MVADIPGVRSGKSEETAMNTTTNTTTNSIDKTPVAGSPRFRRTSISMTALAGAGMLLLAACGGSGDETSVADAAGTVPEGVLTTPGRAPAGADGFEQFAPIDEGTYTLESLGVPVTVTLEGDWWVQPNVLGHTVFSHPDSQRPADRDVVFLRPNTLSDPTQPGAGVDEQVPWELDDIEGWLDNVIDGIVVAGPEQTTIGGRDAVYFEVDIANTATCGPHDYCAGFVINTMDGNGISGWSFEYSFHQRVWWVDGGDHEPLVIIASVPSGLQAFVDDADQLLDSLEIGDPGPHPVADPGV